MQCAQDNQTTPLARPSTTLTARAHRGIGGSASGACKGVDQCKCIVDPGEAYGFE